MRKQNRFQEPLTLIVVLHNLSDILLPCFDKLYKIEDVKRVDDIPAIRTDYYAEQWEIVTEVEINGKSETIELYFGFCNSFIIRKTKCFDFWERNVLFPKTKRSFFRTPKHPLPCPFPLNFSLLIITKKFGNLAKNRYICIV